jgi:UDP-glucose 4-epimerase
MRILVTGGAGYVGSVSVEVLVAAGHEVVVLDDLSTGHAWAYLAGASFIDGTYTDRDGVRRLIRRERIESVLHCAARSLVGQSIADPSRYFLQNVAGGLELLEAMRDTGLRRLVISSTAAVYGVPDASPIPEEAPLRPINPYGETKRTFETAAAWYGSAYGFRTVALRYFNVAGASTRNGEVHAPETHLIPNALAAVAGDGPPLTVFGEDYPTPDGTPIRDYLHVEDLAGAHLAALEATAEGDPRTDDALVCNLGSGRGYSVREVIAAIERVVGRPVPLQVGPRRAGDPPMLVAAIGRAAEVLGWTPAQSNLEAMIGSAWAWRSAHPDELRSSNWPAA